MAILALVVLEVATRVVELVVVVLLMCVVHDGIGGICGRDSSSKP